MARYDRSIKIVFDKISGEILDSKKATDTKSLKTKSAIFLKTYQVLI